MDLVNALLDVIESHPPAIDARVLLMQRWIQLGQQDCAEDNEKELLQIDPSNADALKFLKSHEKGKEKEPKTKSNNGKATSTTNNKYRTMCRSKHLPRTLEERVAMEVELSQGYNALRARAKVLH